MVAHQAITQNLKPKTLMRLLQYTQKCFEILLTMKYILARPATIHDMIITIFIFYPKRSRHENIISILGLSVNMILDPFIVFREIVFIGIRKRF